MLKEKFIIQIKKYKFNIKKSFGKSRIEEINGIIVI